MKKLLVTTVLLLACAVVSAYAGLPDTGQTKCYDNESREITCPQPGEPCYGQDAQYGPNLQSFTKLGYGGVELPDNATEWIMVRDNVTGLVWENKTDDGSIHDKDNGYTWLHSQDVFIATLNTNTFGGFSDWRLPTLKELSYLGDSTKCNPSINTTFFSNTVGQLYWSSTILAVNPDYAWAMDFSEGPAGWPLLKGGQLVRAVRGETSHNHFVNHSDGTVTDTDTGLMWQQDSAPDNYIRETALSYCENLILNNDGAWTNGSPNASGVKYDDWRLPNKNELHSLVDYSRDNPAIDTTYFPDTESAYYCSSTQYTCSLYLFSSVHFAYGSSYSSGNGYIRAVRSTVNTCRADADDDGKVILSDLVILKTEFGRTNCATVPCNADANNDGKVLLSDLVILKSEFGRTNCFQ